MTPEETAVFQQLTEAKLPLLLEDTEWAKQALNHIARAEELLVTLIIEHRAKQEGF